MKPSHRAMYLRAFERLYQEAIEDGMNMEDAEQWAADKAWFQYEQYCDDKLDEMKMGDC